MTAAKRAATEEPKQLRWADRLVQSSGFESGTVTAYEINGTSGRHTADKREAST
jgi:hypothetical protein